MRIGFGRGLGSWGWFFPGWGTSVFGRIAVSFLQECNPSGKGSPKGLVIETPKWANGLLWGTIFNEFFVFSLTMPLICFLKKGTRKAHYSHRQRLLANDMRFCPLLGIRRKRGTVMGGRESSSPYIHIHSIQLQGNGFSVPIFHSLTCFSCLALGV